MYVNIPEENARVVAFLIRDGYELRGQGNIEYQGETFFYEKKYFDIRFLFSWHWETEFENTFWRGELSTTYDFEPGNEFSHPHGIIKVDGIFEEHLKQLTKYEGHLYRASRAIK